MRSNAKVIIRITSTVCHQLWESHQTKKQVKRKNLKASYFIIIDKKYCKLFSGLIDKLFCLQKLKNVHHNFCQSKVISDVICLVLWDQWLNRYKHRKSFNWLIALVLIQRTTNSPVCDAVVSIANTCSAAKRSPAPKTDDGKVSQLSSHYWSQFGTSELLCCTISSSNERRGVGCFHRWAVDPDYPWWMDGVVPTPGQLFHQDTQFIMSIYIHNHSLLFMSFSYSIFFIFIFSILYSGCTRVNSVYSFDVIIWDAVPYALSSLNPSYYTLLLIQR